MAPKRQQQKQKKSARSPKVRATPDVTVWTNYSADNVHFKPDGTAHFAGPMSKEAYQRNASKQARVETTTGPLSFAPGPPPIARPTTHNLFDGNLPSLPSLPAEKKTEPKKPMGPSTEPPRPPQPWPITAKQLAVEIQRGRALTAGKYEPTLEETFFDRIPPIMSSRNLAAPLKGSHRGLPAPLRPQYSLPQAVPRYPTPSYILPAPEAVPVIKGGRTWEETAAIRSNMDTGRPLTDSTFA